MNENYDIIVVGGGPGGASAAAKAASLGYKTLLLEKEEIMKNGRYKACGGAMAWDLIKKTKFPQNQIDRIIEFLELHYVDGDTYHKKGKGAVVWRSKFDRYLCKIAQKEGAEIHESEKLKSAFQSASEKMGKDGKSEKRVKNLSIKIITNKNTYHTKFLIAADGVNSTTLKSLRWPPFLKDDLVLTITQEVESSSKHIKKVLEKHKVHLFFSKNLIPMGYAWLFPKKSMITVGWGNKLSLIKNTKKEFQQYYQLPIVQNAVEGGTIFAYKPHLIPVGERSCLYRDNVFAVGDAAGFVDPISGKGIPYAMLSGKIAVETIHECEKYDKIANVEEIYTRNLEKKFLNTLRAKKQMREKVFRDRTSLNEFLSLWEKYRSSEILQKGLI